MKRAIKVLIAADAFSMFALGMIGPIYAIFVERIGGDILDASWAYFAFTFSSGVALYLLGKLEDKVDHRGWFVIGGYFMNALGCLSYLFVNDQLSLVLTQIILGLGNAVLSPAFDSVYSDYLTPAEKASEWAGWEGSGLIVTALAAITGGYVAKIFGFRSLFILMFVLALFGLLTSIKILGKKRYLNAR